MVFHDPKESNVPGKRRLQPTIELDMGLAYEFLMSILVFFDEDCRTDYTYAVGEEWFDAVAKKVSSETLELVKKFNGSKFSCEKHIWTNLWGLAYECPPPRDVPTLLELIGEMDALDIRLYLIGYYQRKFRRNTPLDVILQAAEGDEEAQRQFLATSFPDDYDWQESLHAILTQDMYETKKHLLAFFHNWYHEVFREQEAQILPILQRDLEAKRAFLPTVSTERFIELATNGVEYVPEPGQRKMLLVPSYIDRPYIMFADYQDMKILSFPVADESVHEDPHAPPVRMVRLYKALADERRLRILKKLTTGSYTLQEIADDFGVSKTTLHHHLAMLRVAGLIRVSSDDKQYSLRQSALSTVSEQLLAYLKPVRS